MYADITKPPAPLPTTRLETVQSGISLLPPLSRRGHGPGLIILVPDSTTQLAITEGVPSPLVKWGEEGYAVVEIQASALTSGNVEDALSKAAQALASCVECDPKGKIGLVGTLPQS